MTKILLYLFIFIFIICIFCVLIDFFTATLDKKNFIFKENDLAFQRQYCGEIQDKDFPTINEAYFLKAKQIYAKAKTTPGCRGIWYLNEEEKGRLKIFLRDLNYKTRTYCNNYIFDGAFSIDGNFFIFGYSKDKKLFKCFVKNNLIIGNEVSKNEFEKYNFVFNSNLKMRNEKTSFVPVWYAKIDYWVRDNLFPVVLF